LAVAALTCLGRSSIAFESSLNTAFVHGRSLSITIGDVKTWTIKKAQDKATRLKTLTDQGIDRREIEREERAKAEATRVRADAEARRVQPSFLSAG